MPKRKWRIFQLHLKYKMNDSSEGLLRKMFSKELGLTILSVTDNYDQAEATIELAQCSSSHEVVGNEEDVLVLSVAFVLDAK
jgi:hypothetical protein